MENVQKVALAVDVDEVLALFIPALAEFHNANYQTRLDSSSFVSYEFHKVWGGTAHDCSKKMDDFFQSEYFQFGVSPVPGAYDALRSLKNEFGSNLEFHVVTARQNKLQSHTKEWLEKHYPDIFQESNIHFGNHYSADGSKSRSKPEMCQFIDAICLIDDSQIYANQCAAIGLPVVLFGDYAWNSDPTMQRVADEIGRVTRAHNWEEAVLILRETIRSRLSGNVSPLLQHRSPHRLASAISNPDLCKVALIQICSNSDKAANINKIEIFIHDAVLAGAKLVCLPEACLFVGESSADTIRNAEHDESDCIIALCGFARKYQVWLSFCLAISSSTSSADKVYNRHLLVDVLGSVVAGYDKIHLFDSPLAGLKESSSTLPGDKLCCNSLNPFGRLGLAVCYDLRFPSLFQKLSEPVENGGHGAEIFLVPSAFTVPTGEAHWEVLIRARAIENQAYIIAAAQAGRHNEKRVSYGNSLVVDPWGRVVCRCDGESEGFMIFSLDLDEVRAVRAKMPVLSHRRNELFA